MAAHVLLATAHDILLRGLGDLLRQARGIHRVTAARSDAEALTALESRSIDVALLDVGSADGSQTDLVEHARGRAAPVPCVALVHQPNGSRIERVIRAGAAGIVSTRSSASMLADAIRCVHDSRGYIAPDVMMALVSGRAGSKLTVGQDSVLSVRERETLRLIAEGFSCREIADELGISVRTVEAHRARLMEKLGLRKTAALVRYAVREGYVAA